MGSVDSLFSARVECNFLLFKKSYLFEQNGSVVDVDLLGESIVVDGPFSFNVE